MMEVLIIFGLSITIYAFYDKWRNLIHVIDHLLGLNLNETRKWKVYVSIFLALVASVIAAAAVSRVSGDC